MDRQLHITDEAGFTLIEVMVAAVLLLVGMLGTLSMVEAANSTTWSTKAREQAVALQREVVESVRGIPYDQLTPTSVGTHLRASANLADSDVSSAGWTVRRRGFTYSIAVGVCSVDDVRDGLGSHDGALFCATGTGSTSAQTCTTLLGVSGAIQGAPAAASAGAAVGDCGIDLNLDGAVDNLTEASLGICIGICPIGTVDTTPSDYKRVVVLVRWDRGKGSRYALQSTTVANPGLAAAPAVVGLTAAGSVPVTSGTSVTLNAVTNKAPATVAWSVDGTQRGTATGAALAWAFTWPLGTVSGSSSPNSGEVLDGSYVVGAKAFDGYGQFGSTRALTVTVNRRAPYPVQNLLGGRNGTAVEFEWSPSPERDIVGYRVYRRPTIGAAVEVCAITSATTCRDTSPPALPLLTYYAVAVDRNSAGSLREGAASPDITVAATNTPPPTPPTLAASLSNGSTVLVWTAPPGGDPDLGDSIAFYRIYRDGSTYADRYDRTGTGETLTFTDTATGGQAHTYWVTAVDTQLAESPKIGPVTR